MNQMISPVTARLISCMTCVATLGISLHAATTVQETDAEFIASADLNGDGLQDVVLVDKATGRVRPGYQQEDGFLKWVEWRDSGAQGVTGLSAGRLISSDRDALAFASQDGNLLTVLDASVPTTATAPVDIPFMLLGPASVVSLNLGEEGDAALHDLFVGSVYNTPDANMASHYLNEGDGFELERELPLPGTPARGNRVTFQPDGLDYMAILFETDAGIELHIQSPTGGALTTVASLSGLEAGTDYTLASIRDSAMNDLLLWTPGSRTLVHHPIQIAEPAAVEFDEVRLCEFPQTIRSVIALAHESKDRLFVIHGSGDEAGVHEFDEAGTPSPVYTLQALTNHLFTGALPTSDGFVAFTGLTNGGSSVRYHLFQAVNGSYEERIYGPLPTLADNDNLTVPDIRARIVQQTTVMAEPEMQPYTNTVPGTEVTYAMMPIPGGEFLLGSPEDEPGRHSDESPQNAARVAPFWMGRCEVTWNELELFIYPDEEKRMRKVNPTDETGDNLADAVTHPSKPYADMTFGMGRNGYPAIAMTQHAASKYCQWLSAKTGHFYRLPTEAEWEYACRAGTSTAYFFGEDDSNLGDYAWYEMNSDFKYQKVGRKQPNPWGLHDMLGNVVEWVLDQYDPKFYSDINAAGIVKNPWNKATAPYPLAVRGGSWDDPAEACRSAARRGSTRAWKLMDPQLPKSIWYFTDAQFVGFRIVRPLEIPDAQTMQASWNSGVERE